MIVADASTVVLALGDDGSDGDAARQRLSGERIVVPELLDVEVVSAWRKHEAAGRIDARRAELARRDLRDLPIERISHRSLMERCWELRANVTMYDAVYVALAEALDAPLVTADAKLAGAPGIDCSIELI
ncbi:type II toxin-antitoxin system VapC family toxin [Candidatus Poriferisodalis sp.]|uniref:type II toxin-antitoxin system VapC family toxin n=1 Tax=Candidatus Poriferisodalis sp. TaxID=3101277 RepID=UPI003B515CFC